MGELFKIRAGAASGTQGCPWVPAGVSVRWSFDTAQLVAALCCKG